MNISGLNPAQVPAASSDSIKTSGQESLHAAAEAFEALFLQQMIQKGREGGLGPSLLSSEAEDKFSSMLDAEQASGAAGQLNLGIADALVKQLSPALARWEK